MPEPPPVPSDRLPAVVPAAEARTRPTTAAAGAVDAQLLGQGAVRRGLRGGAPVLEAAQQTYLETEWSGPSDRRARAGGSRREKV